MGTAADQRRQKRMKFFTTLAKNEPIRFEKEWEKRISSWMENIARDAGRLKNKQKQSVSPVFDRVDEAMDILRNCGKEVYRKYGNHTYDLLTTECCRQFAMKSDRRLFLLNRYLTEIKMDRNN